MKINQIAVTLYTDRDFCQNEKDLFESLKKIKNIGYSSIQISGVGLINPKTIKSMCEDLSLVICATHEPNEQIINNTDEVINKLNIFNCEYSALPYQLNVDMKNLEEIDKFIVFATIFFQGEVKQLEYKAIDFSSKEECYKYMAKHDKHFGEVVDDIRQSIQPTGRLLVIGCSERNKIVRNDNGEWN